MMAAARWGTLLGALVMACVLGYGFGWGDFFAEGRVLFSMPWGVVSLVDVYVGFLLLGGWIWFRESSRVTAVVWILLILCLGNLISCLYVLVALRQSRNDWRRFWMGTPRAA